MDQTEVVDVEFDTGQQLIEQLARSGTDVTAACWLKRSEDRQWLLYIVSKEVTAKGLGAAVHAVQAALPNLPKSLLSVFRIKWIGVDDPIAKDLLDLQKRYPGNRAIHSRQQRLGELDIEEVYVYPPIR